MTVFMNSRDAESNRIKPKIVSISVDESDFFDKNLIYSMNLPLTT